MIKTIQDIQGLVTDGFTDWPSLGNVTVRAFGDLLVFNYNQMAQYAEVWNEFEVMSRGLIINSQTGEIVARSFDKFFNWGERGRFTTAPIVRITEKLDGSLGILYRCEGEHRIATRGSLESEQAIWATEHLHQYYYGLKSLPNELTLLFEIIYPENRVVVDYGNTYDLFLIAARNRFTGEYLSHSDLRRLAILSGFNQPKVYQFRSPDEVISRLGELDANEEGFVAEFADGQRFKFKGRRYLELHKLLTRLSFKNLLEASANGTLVKFLEGIPDEFLGQAKTWIAEIEATIASETERLQAIFATAPKESRKEFAIWVMANHKKDSHYLFNLLDSKDLAFAIYSRHEWTRPEASMIKEEG